MDFSNHTLFCTSYNRHQNLYILAKYLDDFDYNGRLLIVDASDSRIDDKNLPVFVDYHYKQKISAVEAIIETHSAVKTEYISLVGDDDFPCFVGLFECLKTMINNHKLQTCGGETVWIDYQHIIRKSSTSSLANFMNCMMLHKVDQHNNIFNSNLGEIISGMVDNYRVQQFRVMKTILWKKIFNKEFTLIEDKSMGEIASSISIALNVPHSATEKVFLFRGTGYLRPSSNPNDVIHNFPNLERTKNELVNYFRSQGLNKPKQIEILVASCISIRMQEYLIKKPKKLLEYDPNDMANRMKQIFGCKEVLNNLAYLAGKSFS